MQYTCLVTGFTSAIWHFPAEAAGAGFSVGSAAKVGTAIPNPAARHRAEARVFIFTLFSCMDSVSQRVPEEGQLGHRSDEDQ